MNNESNKYPEEGGKMDKDSIWSEFFRLYNEALAEEYANVMEKLPDNYKFNNPPAFSRIKEKAFENMEDWNYIRYDSLGNKTPDDLIKEISTPEEAALVTRSAFEKCDDDIPALLKKKLNSFGDDAFENLQDHILGISWESPESSEEEPSNMLIVSAGVLKLMGEKKYSKGIEKILDKYCNTSLPAEYISDAVKEYLAKLEEDSIKPLTKRLIFICNTKASFDSSSENLLVSLTLASENARSDEVFKCLKNCFNKMDKKIIGAICIGDYGDSRGISFLKGYIEKEGKDIKKPIFYESLSAIKRLGGDISDIKDPFEGEH